MKMDELTQVAPCNARQNASRAFLNISTACVLSGVIVGCASIPKSYRVMAAGEIGGDAISSEVDSDVARYFLEDYLKGGRADPRFDSLIDSILQEMESAPITNEKLKAISDQTSVDFGAMLFAHLETQRNLGIKKGYLREYERVKNSQVDLHEAALRYKIVLIPGLFYQSKPETKGDLRDVRFTLQEHGFEVVSVPILDAGTVEQNARLIADFIKDESETDKEIILVSASKGGPDTLYALGHLLNESDSKKISVWFSIGGALHGSFLADNWIGWPKRWVASVVGLFYGFSVDMIESLSVQKSRERMAQVHIPPHIWVIHFVGVPLSGTVTDKVRGSYEALRSYGPNDGVTLLADEIVGNSTVITTLGLDHWFRDPDLKHKILALVSTVTKEKANPFVR